jgi:hypothetical protein
MWKNLFKKQMLVFKNRRILVKNITLKIFIILLIQQFENFFPVCKANHWNKN